MPIVTPPEEDFEVIEKEDVIESDLSDKKEEKSDNAEEAQASDQKSIEEEEEKEESKESVSPLPGDKDEEGVGDKESKDSESAAKPEEEEINGIVVFPTLQVFFLFSSIYHIYNYIYLYVWMPYFL